MKIPFSPPDITETEIEQVSEALRSGWITTGPKTKELEREVADLCGVNRAVCLNSQTACAEMTLRFRSMKVNAPDIRNDDGSTYNSIMDSRVTRVGHFLRETSIDEIPQIFNILKGDMSIIGPRPGDVESKDTYNGIIPL